MSYVIIGTVFLLLVVFAILAAKTWHWVNIVFLILTFIAGTAAVAGLSQVMSMRYAQMRLEQTSLERKVRLEKEANEAVYGPADAIEYDRNSLRGINEMLTREMAGRGRVWAGGEVTANGENRKFKFAAARTAGNQNDEMQDMVLYAFADGSADGQSFAKSFVGTVRVVSETAEDVDLEPIFVADLSEFAEPKTTWSLFEKMPSDRRDLFKKAQGIAADGDLDIDAYRQILTSEYLKQEDHVKADPAQDQAAYDDEMKAYTTLVDRYAFDGMKLGEIQQWLVANNRSQDDFSPDLQEEFVEFRFNKRSDPFTVDASTGNLDTDGRFTKRGLAVDPALYKGEPVVFEKDDTILVDRRTAEGYQLPDGTQVPPFSTGKDVSEIGRYYIRQLKDFPYELADLKRQTERFVVETERVKANTVVTEESLADADAQVTERDGITGRLEQDNQNLKNDLRIITSLQEARSRELQQELERVRLLKAQIRQRYSEIITSQVKPKSNKRVASK